MTSTDKTLAKSGVSHAHVETAMDARVAALEARVTKLETPVVPPPTGTWFGLPDPWAGIPFGSLPSGNALVGSNGLWLTGSLSGKTFSNLPAGRNVLVLDGLAGVTLDLLDFDTVPEAIYLNNCTNVTISRIRARNIFGPFTRTGFHSGNLIQASNCSRLHIADVKVVQPSTVPAGYVAYGTEDIISLGGNPGTWGDVTVERFAFDGGAWQSPSGTGLFIGDGASGHDVTVRDGILVNPGQCAIGTGEEGPYTFERLDIWSDKPKTNAAMQIRTTKVTATAVRIDWPGGNIGNAGVAADFARPEIVL